MQAFYNAHSNSRGQGQAPWLSHPRDVLMFGPRIPPLQADADAAEAAAAVDIAAAPPGDVNVTNVGAAPVGGAAELAGGGVLAEFSVAAVGNSQDSEFQDALSGEDTAESAGGSCGDAVGGVDGARGARASSSLGASVHSQNDFLISLSDSSDG